jgi:hypothetical protein
MIFKKLIGTFITTVAAIFLISCSGLIAPDNAPDLICDRYYVTEDGKTFQIFPEDDYAFVKDADARSADGDLGVRPVLIWFDLDDGWIILSFDDAPYGDCDRAFAVKVDNVQGLFGPDYANVIPMGSSILQCERLEEILAQQLAE